MATIADDGMVVTCGRDFWLRRAAPIGRWRQRARAAMREIVLAHEGADTATLLALVDERYPFGPRRHHPYKAWLEERRLLVGDLEDVPATAAEWEEILVAIDMVEAYRNDDGTLSVPPERAVEISAWLDKRAPHRHGRRCATCAAPKGKPCREPDLSVAVFDTRGMGRSQQLREFTDRLIPHAARVQP